MKTGIFNEIHGAETTQTQRLPANTAFNRVLYGGGNPARAGLCRPPAAGTPPRLGPAGSARIPRGSARRQLRVAAERSGETPGSPAGAAASRPARPRHPGRAHCGDRGTTSPGPAAAAALRQRATAARRGQTPREAKSAAGRTLNRGIAG